MTRGLVRFQQTGEFHFLTLRSYRRLAYLGSARGRDLFESALERIRCRYNFLVAGYVVMPEHVHLLASEPRKGMLSRAAVDGCRRVGKCKSRMVEFCDLPGLKSRDLGHPQP